MATYPKEKPVEPYSPINCFRIKKVANGFQLIHIPSGQTIQREYKDFNKVSQAAACRDNIIAAAADWDWRHDGLFEEMPNSVWLPVWKAIYA